MSRFDLFFVILDECNPEIDESIARHIISKYLHFCEHSMYILKDPSNRVDVHKEGGVDEVCTAAAFSREQLQRYISFARSINPTLSPPARKVQLCFAPTILILLISLDDLRLWWSVIACSVRMTYWVRTRLRIALQCDS